MVKVEVFSTLAEADNSLRIHVSKNVDLAHKIFTELQERAKVYKQTAEFDQLHPGNKEAKLTTGELTILSRGLARGETATALVKLYAFDLNRFAFDYTVFNPNDALTFAAYNSIDALSAKVREQLDQEKGGNIGLRTEPIIYTVLEPFTYSKVDKWKARQALNYKGLSREDKLILDKHLDYHLERGLSAIEIQEFKSAYVKFLN